MSNIEDDIKKLNKFNEYENAVVLSEEALYEIQEAIEHILSEREQDKERIKELESKLEEANKQLDLDYVDENYIPKQKVEDYLKEEQERFEVYKKESETNENLKFGMWKHLGAKNMCEKILGIEKNMVTLD